MDSADHDANREQRLSGIVLLNGRDMTTSPGAEVCIGVVIVTYNSSAHVERLTTSLKDALSSVKHRVVVVDNASSDDTVAALRSKGIEVIEMGRNAGYSAAINAGLQVLADASAVLILNPDLSLGRGAVDAMYAELRDPAVGVVVPQTREFSGALAYNQRRDPTLLRAIGSTVLGAARAGRWSTLSEMVEDTATYLRARSRCLQPGQQQGRRWPSSSSSWVRRMRRSRVISCLASSTQQMNSLRAKGVMSLQAASAVALAISALRRSTGSLCTTPPGTRWLLTGPG